MKFHCMNSVELILLKCIPRVHPNPCSRVGLSCSIFKNTSATCAYPLVSNARKLKRDKRAHACAQGTFSYTYAMFEKGPFPANIYVPYIFFVRPLLVHRTYTLGRLYLPARASPLVELKMSIMGRDFLFFRGSVPLTTPLGNLWLILAHIYNTALHYIKFKVKFALTQRCNCQLP